MTDADILTVGEITRAIADLFRDEFPRVAVRGQISNLHAARSGHVYFTLKDDDAQLGAVMWKSRAGRLRFRPEDGQEVVASGKLEVYPPHGKYQLIADALQPLGLGDLHVRFEQLKKQLADEGLFAPDRKRSLPLLPRRVAIVTSPTSAAIRDMLRISYRRMPDAWVTVFPVRVQGDAAAAEIAAALADLPRVGRFDAVIVGRGGGSIEDLWSFNEEAVARAIAASPFPVVSAVGHETDTTIADFVADVRAATPSEAAEIVFPETAVLAEQLAEGGARLSQAVRKRIERVRERLDHLEQTHALRRPVERLHQIAQTLDDLEERGLRALTTHVARARDRLARTAGHLEAVSPLAVLGRGYSITTREGGRDALRSPARLARGDLLRTRLARGSVVTEVKDVIPPEGGDPTEKMA